MSGYFLSGNRTRLFALALAALSGAAGLMHQVLWVRRMVDVLGANAGTFSRVVAAFFLGLALGAWWAARRPTPRPWRSVAVAEGGVALLAVAVLFSSGWVQSWPLDPLRAQLLSWLLPLVLITPPAVAMGLVVPWMIRAVGPQHAVLLYGVNTLGGLGGLVLAPGWALPVLGLAGASWLALSLNVVVGLGAWGLAPRVSAAEDAGTAVDSSGRRLPPADLAVAFASGFLILGSEVIFQHQFAQILISSHLSSALVLTFVLTALGAAALLLPLTASLGRWALPIALSVATLACAGQPAIFVIQRGGLSYLPFQQPFLSYLGEALRVGFPACALILLPAGFVFPLLLRRAAMAGVDAGRLLAINGLGGWLGAELTERVLAPAFGLWWTMAVLAAGYALCFLCQSGSARWWATPLLACVIAWTWRIDGRLPYAGLTPGDTLVSVAVGREGVVGVVRGEPDDWRILFNNTYTLGGSRAQTNQERQMLLPMLLHGGARRVATLGVATGSTLAGATLDPILEHAEGMELSPLVLRYARESFAPFNRHVFADPRIHCTLADARWLVAQRPAAFDVIEGDLFLPWRTGEGRLFAREHFANVRAALRPGGLFCQWLPVYQLTRPQFDTIARTFREVFPEAWVIRGDFYVGMPILGLVGGRDLASIDWHRVEEACARVRAENACRDPLLRHVEGIAMCVAGPLPAPENGPVNTLANAWLEWNAARNVIGLREPWFTGVPCADYLRAASRSGSAILPENLRTAQAAGDLCLTLEVARSANLAQADGIESKLRSALPMSLQEDRQADWLRWPMRYRPALP